jgi:hypothetical protein
MTSDSEPWRGRGETPRDAVQSLVPSPEDPGIAWVEGINAFPAHAEPPETSSPIKREVNIIYESQPVKQWNVEVSQEQDGWRAVLFGGRKPPMIEE